MFSCITGNPLSTLTRLRFSSFLREKERQQKARQRAKKDGICDEDAVGQKRWVVTGVHWRVRVDDICSVAHTSIPLST
jgi:hypothetical protein